MCYPRHHSHAGEYCVVPARGLTSPILSGTVCTVEGPFMNLGACTDVIRREAVECCHGLCILISKTPSDPILRSSLWAPGVRVPQPRAGRVHCTPFPTCPGLSCPPGASWCSQLQYLTHNEFVQCFPTHLTDFLVFGLYVFIAVGVERGCDHVVPGCWDN